MNIPLPSLSSQMTSYMAQGSLPSVQSILSGVPVASRPPHYSSAACMSQHTSSSAFTSGATSQGLIPSISALDTFRASTSRQPLPAGVNPIRIQGTSSLNPVVQPLLQQRPAPVTFLSQSQPPAVAPIPQSIATYPMYGQGQSSLTLPAPRQSPPRPTSAVPSTVYQIQLQPQPQQQQATGATQQYSVIPPGYQYMYYYMPNQGNAAAGRQQLPPPVLVPPKAALSVDGNITSAFIPSFDKTHTFPSYSYHPMKNEPLAETGVADMSLETAAKYKIPAALKQRRASVISTDSATQRRGKNSPARSSGSSSSSTAAGAAVTVPPYVPSPNFVFSAALLEQIAKEGIDAQISELRFTQWVDMSKINHLHIHKQHYKLRIRTKRPSVEENRDVVHTFKTRLQIKLLYRNMQTNGEWRDLNSVPNRLNLNARQERQAITYQIIPNDGDQDHVYFRFSIFASSHQLFQAEFSMQFVCLAEGQDEGKQVDIFTTQGFTTRKKFDDPIKKDKQQKRKKRSISALSPDDDDDEDEQGESGLSAAAAAAASSSTREQPYHHQMSFAGAVLQQFADITAAQEAQRQQQSTAAAAAAMRFDPLMDVHKRARFAHEYVHQINNT